MARTHRTRLVAEYDGPSLWAVRQRGGQVYREKARNAVLRKLRALGEQARRRTLRDRHLELGR